MRSATALALVLLSTSAAANDSECRYGQIGQFVALLENYAPAQTYCSNLLSPQQLPATITTTITQCRPDPTAAPPAKIKARQEEDSTQIDHETGPAAALQQLRRSHRISNTVCACIVSATSETPIIETTYVTTSCSSTSTCNPRTLTCQPKRNCANPARCASSSYCLESPISGACFCHPDTDDPTAGYCMSAGPGCPEVYEDCSSNSDCGGPGSSKVCIYACCREQPFCVDLEDYRTNMPSMAGASAAEGGSEEAGKMKRDGG